MEDDVYLCQWKKTTSGFRLWVQNSADWFVEGHGDVVGLSNQLAEKIAQSGGAQVAVIEFDRPFPKSAFDVRYSQPEIYAILGDDRFQVACPNQNDAGWFDNYFDQPHCSACGMQSGNRNEEPLTADYVRPSYDGGFISCCGRMLSVFSDGFLDLLTVEERQSLNLVPLITAKKSRRKWYELTGPSGPSHVGVRALEAKGWKCPTCGFHVFGYWSEKTTLNSFVAQSDLSGALPSVFTIGARPNDVRLCMTAERWFGIVGKKETRGLTATQIGVAPDEDVIRSLQLPPLSQTPKRH